GPAGDVPFLNVDGSSVALLHNSVSGFQVIVGGVRRGPYAAILGDPSWGRGGRLAYCALRADRTPALVVDGRETPLLPARADTTCRNLAFSPDGRRTAVIVGSASGSTTTPDALWVDGEVAGSFSHVSIGRTFSPAGR